MLLFLLDCSEIVALQPTTGAVSVILYKVVIFKIKNGIIMGMVTFIKPDILEKKVENFLYPEV
ncbi:hypothetical protein CD32_01425 [Lysinibacillus odysseyi 34hs-1 = NBRC 100172]|uniref:Uncharacterized protein n=1 Tax=Lysinibacillus odysseyi 34hs-1 = NBRC 100172 TaxID=1220589 RepID=A0A0A3IV13_9BACI|nr:hypothetical protein CD32_01425 [Lysinibacillus odysseyi 34hs-1 = NBRC 100172]